MFDKTDIRAAVEASVISADQAARFENFLKTRNDPDRMLDPENLRFLTNFNDVFLTIGLSILIAGVGFMSGQAFNTLLGTGSADAVKWTVVLTPLPVLAAAWGLAEYFCGRRRLLLPSMFLSAAVCASAAVAVTALLAPTDQASLEASARASGDEERFVLEMVTGFVFAGFGAAAAAALAVFVRFRLPFSLFLLALSVAGLFYTAVLRVTGDPESMGAGATTLFAGVVTLLAAIWFDMKDPQRASLSSDNAFWLHMAAAPQIIFGVRGLVLGSGFAPAGVADAVVMLAILLAFAGLSLALNRRALIVSGLVSFITALWVLVDRAGVGSVGTLALTALLVGGSIVLLGGGWRTARRGLLKIVPHQGFAGRIFPPEPA